MSTLREFELALIEFLKRYARLSNDDKRYIMSRVALNLANKKRPDKKV